MCKYDNKCGQRKGKVGCMCKADEKFSFISLKFIHFSIPQTYTKISFLP